MKRGGSGLGGEQCDILQSHKKDIVSMEKNINIDVFVVFISFKIFLYENLNSEYFFKVVIYNLEDIKYNEI